MEEYIVLWVSASTVLAFTISPLILIGCGGKKPAAAGADPAVGADGKPAIPTKACNTKSGLLNDDPDLKSDLLMAKPAAGEKEPSAAAPPPA
uniref:Uncharacterized protein n=1 Tax=Panagrolaimus superbus TaxID=310955 RepID=A0A914ZBR9_9BILA